MDTEYAEAANRLTDDISVALARAQEAGLTIDEQISELELAIMALREEQE